MPRGERKSFLSTLRENKNAIMLAVGLARGAGGAMENESVRHAVGLETTQKQEQPFNSSKEQEEKDKTMQKLVAQKRQDEEEMRMEQIRQEVAMMPETKKNPNI